MTVGEAKRALLEAVFPTADYWPEQLALPALCGHELLLRIPRTSAKIAIDCHSCGREFSASSVDVFAQQTLATSEGFFPPTAEEVALGRGMIVTRTITE